VRAARLSLVVWAVCGSVAWAGENWPQWRGPSGNGTSDSTNLPTEWDLASGKNIVWKAALPSWSGGTPVIWGDNIFVTSPSAPAPAADGGQETGDRRPGTGVRGQEPGAKGPAPEGKGFRGKGGKGFGGGFRGGFGGGFGGEGRDPGGPDLLLLCLSKKDGSLLWQRTLDTGVNRLHRKQNRSSPSPVTDGTHVWALTGSGAVAAFDFAGKEIWKRNIQEDYGQFGLGWGYASSPILHDGKLIIQVLHGNNTDDPSYLVAFDASSGKPLWRKERWTDAVRESPDAYTTPALLAVNGKQQIVVSGGDYVTGHDPDTGEELWRAAGTNPRRESNYRVIASPVVAGEMVFAPTRRRPMLALRAGGTGDVTDSHKAWTFDLGPDVPTPVGDGKLLYVVDDAGTATCLDAATGQVVAGPLRTNIGGVVSSSPILADGKIYFTNESARTVVLSAAPDFQVLALNELDGSYTLSSIAVSGQQLFLRTSTHLYCIANPGAQ
jgi:outer membrane protein assembly factor BamB